MSPSQMFRPRAQRRLFETRGVHVLVDGQYGSTGKGALAAWLALVAEETGAIIDFDGVITSAGPNSGHTSYFNGEKIVLKQLPTFGVHAHLRGATMPVYLSAGAIIDPEILFDEAYRYPKIPIFVHPNAAVISPEDIAEESRGTILEVAGTKSGTGACLARKIKRDPSAIWANHRMITPSNISTMAHNFKPWRNAYFMEVSQGYSLGINSHFYPKVTSRECTVMQAIADAGIPPRLVAKTYMCVRTFPIRVGNTEYNSGGWYSDQAEISWKELGVEQELTTVTKRVRRVATFSMDQLADSLRANDPDWLAVNFLNYINDEGDRARFLGSIDWIIDLHYRQDIGLIGGYGPKVEDWEML